MKRIIAILSLFIFVSVNTAFGQILKVPVLLHHFLHYEHEGHDHPPIEGHHHFNSNLFDFLKDHYGQTDNAKDSDNQDHRHLPFKNIKFSQSSVAGFPLQTTIHFFVPVKPQDFVCHYEDNYASGEYGSIWQPPKIG